jgi:hypothetical protein
MGEPRNWREKEAGWKALGRWNELRPEPEARGMSTSSASASTNTIGISGAMTMESMVEVVKVGVGRSVV